MAKSAFSGAAGYAASAVVLTAALAGCNIDNGTGNYVGAVSRFQTDGWLEACKTWEGEMASMNIRGARSGGAGGGNTMHFTVRDPEIAKQIEDAMLSQSLIRVEFSETHNPWPCHQSSNDIVTKVIPMEGHAHGLLSGAQNGSPVAEEGISAAMTAAASGEKIFACKEIVQPAAAATAGADVSAAKLEVPVTMKQPPAAKPQLPDVLRIRK